MSPLSCIIIDDEPIARNILLEYIQRDNRLSLSGNYAMVADALREFSIKKPKLIFLDIKMPGIDGFEMLRSMPQHPYVIFTTAYREYAVEGFNLNAVDYLLKPFSFERFLQAVNKVHVLYTADATEAIPASTNTDESDKHIFVKSDGKFIRINIDGIYYIEALKEYVRIFTADGSWIVYQTMQNLEDKLPKELFFRIHRSYIVGLRHIKSIEGNMVSVNKIELPISRNAKEEFMSKVAKDNFF
ncbi:MAG: response regulator transcription factor [Bacteroidetes bacterium]|nr:response regulator transcription factor [Bacteroidota bacterium]